MNEGKLHFITFRYENEIAPIRKQVVIILPPHSFDTASLITLGKKWFIRRDIPALAHGDRGPTLCSTV